MDIDRELERAAAHISDLRLWVAIYQASRLLKKYSAEQPRVPAGVHEGGQWAAGNGQSDTQVAIGPRLSKAACWEQYDKDTFHCTMVGLRSCHEQAGQRYAACLAGTQIPPLNY